MPHRIKTFVLIDDDLITNYLHKRVLSKTKFSASQIIIANDGQEGVDVLLGLNKIFKNTSEQVVVFLDINMPVMDGWSFLNAFEGLKESIKFKTHLFVLSSSINPDDKSRAEKSGLVTKYLEKPLSIEVIEELQKTFN